MHEMSLALSIVDRVKETASREKAVRVMSVEIEVGSLAGVLADSLRFCLDVAANDGGLAETEFRITETRGAGSCRICGATFAADSFLVTCPSCNSDEVSISGGQELLIRSLTIED